MWVKKIQIKRNRKAGAEIRTPSDNQPNEEHDKIYHQLILMNRPFSRIRPEIGREQCEFVKDIATRNAMLRIISEREKQIQKNGYLWFINYAKAFDEAPHKELFELHG